MTRILLLETASPKRVRSKAEALLSGSLYPEPELTILCTDDAGTIAYYNEIGNVRVVPMRRREIRPALQALRARDFDIVLVFWTGEKRYRPLKWRALLLGARQIVVDSGDGGSFRLTASALARFLIFRCKHPLPSDHWEFVPAPASAHYPGEKVLIVQSAEPPHVLQALDRLRERRLFYRPRYALFCRNKPEVVRCFRGHPMIAQLILHTETRNGWQHWRSLRRERFGGMVLFLTGDPSYWKVKCFAFLLGARTKVVFNENNDCFYFTWRAWLKHVAHRMDERSRLGYQPRWAARIGILLFLLLKSLVLPFRFLWLLGVRARLRNAARKASQGHDRSLRLPPFPG